jgi:peptidoglycan/LPS O-acetylase OafA/YrhL
MEKIYYRKDIDGIRGICIIAVILGHLGLLPGGSVDIFFVISGFLITGIIQRQRESGTFSLKQFYIKRIRRIIPLLLVINSIALIAGLFIMLPDDLENLAESIVATNFFSNNLLLYLTHGNYWAIDAGYKPLLHTWTLAIEEQFYLFYPLLLLLFKSRRSLFVALTILTLISLGLYFNAHSGMVRYYFPHTRFFELGAGGLASFAVKQLNKANVIRVLALIAMFTLLFFSKTLHISTLYKSPLITIATVLFLLPVKTVVPSLQVFILENKLVRGIGLISYSLYMWHQPVLAFLRYTLEPEITIAFVLGFLLVITVLSAITYYVIEQPFRDKNKTSKMVLFGFIGSLFIVTTTASLMIYRYAGVVRPVPELNIAGSETAVRNMHALYNDSIYSLDKPFIENGKKKILIVGHSFARDWANVLLQSRYKDDIQISYIFKLDDAKDARERIQQADFIYFSPLTKKAFEALSEKFNIDVRKVKITGFKNYGISNGVFYTKRRQNNYCTQRVAVPELYINLNNKYKKEWGDKYIDLMGMVIDANGKVPVFTPNCKFISQDCKHFTRGGAIWYAQLIGTLPELE